MIIERNCHLPANVVYRRAMQVLHLVNLPIYFLIVVVLFRMKSQLFQTYKYFLIWHTVVNEAIEFFTVYLMLPVVHLPYPLLRTTGLLSEMGFSGLFQFYLFSILIIQTGCSILEMFYFRYKASLYDYEARGFTRFMKISVFACRFCVVLFPILTFGTFFYSIERQGVYKLKLLQDHPDIFREVTCYSVVLAAPFSDSVMIGTMLIWLSLILITFAAIPSTTVYLNSNLRADENTSPGVIRMQRMLLLSVFVQAFVHGLMLGAPNILFVYAIFFGSENESIAYFAFICLTFHGVISTIAMIIFTKPIRDGISNLFSFKNYAQ